MILLLFPVGVTFPDVGYVNVSRNFKPHAGRLVEKGVGFTLVVVLFHNTGPPLAPRPLKAWRSGEPVWVPAAKWTQKSHPMRENNVSASSCVQLFACWPCIQLSASPPWRTVPLCALGTITSVSQSLLSSCSGLQEQESVFVDLQTLTASDN